MTSPSSRPRLLFHVQHMLGIGHRVRAERITRACLEAGFDVTLMEGGVPDQVTGRDSSVLNGPGLTRIQLPPARWADAGFSSVIDAQTGREIDPAWQRRRRNRVLSALAGCKPDIVLIEGYPFARRAFHFELDPLILQAREGGARVAVSIRDILVARPDQRKTARIAEAARSNLDQIFVHGDPGFAQLSDSFTAACILADRIFYTGIVSASPRPPAPDALNNVVISAGGGAAGSALFRAALEAREKTVFANHTWRFLMGPNLPEADRAILQAARPGIIVEPARADFQAVLGAAALSISQAGYNTVADLAITGCPAVLVPFEGPTAKETEQSLRAGLMQQGGRAICIPEPLLTAERLAEAVNRAARLKRQAPPPYKIDGARQTAHALLSLIEQEGP